MRVGENPMKYSRKSNGEAQIKIKKPTNISACTITYIPHLENYYEESLDILKLSILSLRASTTIDFDIIVYDNGSCDEVIDWLKIQLKKNIIQELYLSKDNRKKLGAWNHLFSSVMGEYIYYFDSDIFHKKKILEEMIELLDNFNQECLITANHNIPSINALKSKSNLKNIKNIKLFHQNFFDKEKLIEIAKTMTTNVEDWVQKKMKNKEIKIIFDNDREAFLGGSHAQFLIKKETIKKIFPLPPDIHLNNNDSIFEEIFFSKGFVKLTTVKEMISHLGNKIDDSWRDELLKIDVNFKFSKKKIDMIKLPKILVMILRLPFIKFIIKKLYNFLFSIIYKIY